MDVLFLGAGRPYRGQAPSALKPLALKARALDWQLDSLRALASAPRIQFVGGYGVDQVARLYPQLNYVIVPDWEAHGVLHSLMRANFGEAEALIAYSDTVFRKEALSALLAVEGDVAFGYDSRWRDRYPMRAPDDIARAETIAFELGGGAVTAEFTGLLHLGPAAAAYLRSADEGALGANLVDLIAHLRGAGFAVAPVDLAGMWAEFDDPRDVARFVLGTKADTLARLAPRVTRSRIGAQTTFTVAEWNADREPILDRIESDHAAALLIVRSSSAVEDGWRASHAGRFDSIADVDGGDRAQVAAAIERVIASYGTGTADHQVLVQAQVRDVRCAGVVLSCGLDSGSPYYRINVDDGGSTSGVTGGTASALRTLLIGRDSPERLATLDAALVPVLDAVREVEEILAYDRLDVEFGQDRSGAVHLFQVRPITVDHGAYEFDADELRDQTEANIAQFRSLQATPHTVVGARTIFGVMPDWNPAEIVGTRPRPLALSLYQRLVTDDVWAAQRAGFGYRDVRPHPLLASFSGQPYVDVRASFNSFVPASMDDDAAARIVDAYVALLAARPHLHDKVEFEIAFTVWDPALRDEAARRLGAFGVREADIAALDAGLKAITREALTRLDRDIAPIAGLDARRETIERGGQAPHDKAVALIEDCARLGTPAFAHAARAGFVASTLLKRMVALGLLSDARRNAFLHGLNTVTRQLHAEKVAHAAGAIPFDRLVERFGHLRPGTYEVTRHAYWEEPARFFAAGAGDAVAATAEPFAFDANERRNVEALLGQLDVALDAEGFAGYLRAALEARESVKFAFTRNVSRALDHWVEAAGMVGLARDDLSFLRYQDLTDLCRGATTPAQMLEAARRGRELYRLTQVTELPPLIVDPADFLGFEQPLSAPNFITLESVQGAVQPIDSGAEDVRPGAIVLIRRADPGYDWLLGQGIGGLVTQYGGANSHMAIRAAELGLPAAIGVGDRYEEIAAMRMIELDCAQRIIRELA